MKNKALKIAVLFLIVISVFVVGFKWGSTNLDRLVLGSGNYGSDPNATADITLQNGEFITNVTDGVISTGTATRATTPVDLASATTVTVPQGNVFNLTGTGKITRMLGGVVGREITFFCVTTDTIVDGVNIKAAGNLNATADDMITFVYCPSGAAADTFWVEKCRSVN